MTGTLRIWLSGGLCVRQGWSAPFGTVARHCFVERFWVAGREAAYDVQVDSPSIEALKVVYSDEALITRRDEKGDPTSSASQPAVVAMMLEALDLKPGLRVLEIGAGTGYNAALMAEVVGDQRLVTTIDIDADVVAQTGRLLGTGRLWGRLKRGLRRWCPGLCGERAVRSDCGHGGVLGYLVGLGGSAASGWAAAGSLGARRVPSVGQAARASAWPAGRVALWAGAGSCGCAATWKRRVRGHRSPPDFGGRPPDEVLPLFPALERALRSQPAGVDREVEWWRVPGAWYDFHFFLSLCDVRAYRGPEGLGLVDDDGAMCGACQAEWGLCLGALRALSKLGNCMWSVGAVGHAGAALLGG